MHQGAWKCAIVSSGVMQPGDKIFPLTGALAGFADPREAFQKMDAIRNAGQGVLGGLHVDITGWRPDDLAQTTALIEYFSNAQP